MTPLGSGRLVWGEISHPLPADVIMSTLQLPGKLVDRCHLVWIGLAKLANVVTVFGGVILHGMRSAVFLTSQLHDREDSAKFADHPVLKTEHTRRLTFNELTIEVTTCFSISLKVPNRRAGIKM